MNREGETKDRQIHTGKEAETKGEEDTHIYVDRDKDRRTRRQR